MGHNKDPTFTSMVVLEGKQEEGRVDKVLKGSMTGNFWTLAEDRKLQI